MWIFFEIKWFVPSYFLHQVFFSNFFLLIHIILLLLCMSFIIQHIIMIPISKFIQLRPLKYKSINYSYKHVIIVGKRISICTYIISYNYQVNILDLIILMQTNLNWFMNRDVPFTKMTLARIIWLLSHIQEYGYLMQQSFLNACWK